MVVLLVVARNSIAALITSFSSTNYFGVLNNPPYLYVRFYCSGYEQSLLSCSRSYSSLLYCGNSEIAGVRCVGKPYQLIKFPLIGFKLK